MTKILITGGKGKVTLTEIYDPEADAWTTLGPMSEWRAEHAAVLGRHARAADEGLGERDRVGRR